MGLRKFQLETVERMIARGVDAGMRPCNFGLVVARVWMYGG